MKRLSPITVGMLCLAAAVGLAAAYSLIRSPVPAVAPVTDREVLSGASAAPVPPVSPATLLPLPTKRLSPRPPASVTAVGRTLPPSAPTSPAVVTVEAIHAPPVPDGGVFPPVRRVAAAAAAWRRYRATQQADAMVFETLKLDEATRAAIRKVNENNRPLPSRLFAPAADGGLAPDPDHIRDGDGPARHIAIEGVLGANGAKDFFQAEGAARASIENQAAAGRAAASDGGTPARSESRVDGGAPPPEQPPGFATPSSGPPAPTAGTTPLEPGVDATVPAPTPSTM